ncbi:MAG: helix-turn-helix domain-containing protein [Micrococcales bacterium]|nr:helix-turn-helix domain-containing protein [Micrococcales bacterium]
MAPSQVTELLAEYQAGTPVGSLAKRFDVHRLTVSQIAKRAGVTPRWSPTTPAQRKHAAALYAEGWTLAQVAEQVDISTGTVRAAVLAEGGTLRPKGHRGR